MNCNTRKFINLCPTLAAGFLLIACEPGLRAKVDGSALPLSFDFMAVMRCALFSLLQMKLMLLDAVRMGAFSGKLTLLVSAKRRLE
jgi:hypothetical protein